MSRVKLKTAKFKIQRALGEELPGLGKIGALAKRKYPPGMHGQGRKRRTDYGIRLMEKQKVVYHYGVRERQLRRYIKMAKGSKSVNWIDAFFGLLESRLDNVVFRLGFAPSMPAARQMVSHGKVFLNGKKLDIPSAFVKVGDEISLKDKVYESTLYMQTRQSPRLELPQFLEVRTDNKKEIGTVLSIPDSTYVPFPLETRYIAEFYNKVKA